MEFRQLEIFRALAEELHFGRTAERLFLAQSSVSQQIRRLETELGAVLIHRSSRSVRLTPAGSVLLAETEQLLAGRERAIGLVRQTAAGRQGALRIAANYPASRALLLPLLERLRVQRPHVTTMLRELTSADQFRELVRGDLDVGLAYGPVDVASLRAEHLLDVPVVGVVRASHPLASRTQIELREVAEGRYITAHAGATSSIEDALVAAAARAGVRLRRSPSATDLSGYLLELETTDTIGFSSLARGQQSRANGMHMLRLVPEPMLGIYAVWHPERDDPLVNSVILELERLAEAVPDPS